MKRANRVVISKTETGYEATFYKTHAEVGKLMVSDAEWQHSDDANVTTARNEFRDFAIKHATDADVEWKPELQKQAWERKYSKYETDEQVGEDASTLLGLDINKVIGKAKYGSEIVGVTMTDIQPKECNLGYVIDGKYEKSGCWAYGAIEMAVTLNIDNPNLGKCTIDVIIGLDMVSGQIKKPHITVGKWNEMVETELRLEGIIEDVAV